MSKGKVPLCRPGRAGGRMLAGGGGCWGLLLEQFWGCSSAQAPRWAAKRPFSGCERQEGGPACICRTWCPTDAWLVWGWRGTGRNAERKLKGAPVWAGVCTRGFPAALQPTPLSPQPAHARPPLSGLVARGLGTRCDSPSCARGSRCPRFGLPWALGSSGSEMRQLFWLCKVRRF